MRARCRFHETNLSRDGGSRTGEVRSPGGRTGADSRSFRRKYPFNLSQGRMGGGEAR